MKNKVILDHILNIYKSILFRSILKIILTALVIYIISMTLSPFYMERIYSFLLVLLSVIGLMTIVYRKRKCPKCGKLSSVSFGDEHKYDHEYVVYYCKKCDKIFFKKQNEK